MEIPIRTLLEMPEIYGQADKDWIIQQLARLTPAVRQKAALRYAAVYQEAFDAESV